MNQNQYFNSVELHPANSMWQELTENEQEELSGGKQLLRQVIANGKLVHVYDTECQVLPLYRYDPTAGARGIPTYIGAKYI